MAEGDCFEVAGKLVMEHHDWTLCHGIVTGRGPIFGVRHWHAWCEHPTELDMSQLREMAPEWEHIVNPTIRVVEDHSNGKVFTGIAAQYYLVGQIDQTTIWRYSHVEAMTNLVRHEHWGPWDD